MMQRTILAGIIAAGISACAALAGTPAASPKFSDREGQIEFATPSGNIGCVYTPAGGTSWHKPAGGGPELACDRVKPAYMSVRMGPTGAVQRTDNPGEQPCCGAENVLAYGQTWTAGPFTCASAKTGLMCKRDDGRGWALSKKAVRVD